MKVMEIVFNCRNTRSSNALTKPYVFLLVNGVPTEKLKPVISSSSKTGTHWRETYRLEKDKSYLVILIDISNSGNHYCKMYTVGKVDSPIFLTQDVLQVMCPCLLSKLGL